MFDELEGKIIADKYRVESLIRESDSGDLYHGKHDITGLPVILRILPRALAMDARWAKAFLDSARAAASIDDRNVLRLTDFGTDSKGTVYAVHESVNGRTLADLIADETNLDQAKALNFAVQAADGAAAIQGKGYVHGDISPENIFIDGDEARLLPTVSSSSDVTSRKTSNYVAPEQLGEFSVTDERSDVYSLGAVIYRSLTGEMPAEELVPMSAFRQDLHKQIEPIVSTALARSADERYQTIAAFAEDLKRVRDEVTPSKASAATAGKNIWQTAFIALAGIVLLGGALIYFTTGKKTDPETAMAVDVNAMPVQPIGPATGAQEESLMKFVASTDAMVLDPMLTPPGTLAGGDDGLNPWANGGAPPIGAPAPMGGVIPPTGMPPAVYIPPGGQTVTVDPSIGGSQFMPPEGGVILVPIPANTPEPKVESTPKTPAANTAAPQPTPGTATTGPKTFATPQPKAPKTTKPATKPKSGPAAETGSPAVTQ
jgi:hypothetical protein